MFKHLSLRRGTRKMPRGDFMDESSELVNHFHSKEPIRCTELLNVSQPSPAYTSLLSPARTSSSPTLNKLCAALSQMGSEDKLISWICRLTVITAFFLIGFIIGEFLYLYNYFLIMCNASRETGCFRLSFMHNYPLNMLTPSCQIEFFRSSNSYVY